MLEWNPTLQLLSILSLMFSTFIGGLIIVPQLRKVKLTAYIYIVFGYTIASFSGIFGLLGFLENSVAYYKTFIIVYTLALIPVYLVFRRYVYSVKALFLDILFFTGIYLEVLFIYYYPFQVLVINGQMIVTRSRDIFGWLVKLLDHFVLAFTIFYTICRSVSIKKKDLKMMLAVTLFIGSSSLIFVLTVFTMGYLNPLHYLAYSSTILIFALILYKWPEIFVTSGLHLNCIALLNENGVELKKLMIEAFDENFYRNIIRFIYQTQIKPRKKEAVYVIIEGRAVISIPVNNNYLLIMGKNIDKDLINLMKYRLKHVNNDLEKVWSKTLNLLT